MGVDAAMKTVNCPSIETHLICPRRNPCRCRGVCTVSGQKLVGRTKLSDEAKATAIDKWRRSVAGTRAETTDLATVCAAQDKLATRLETRVLALRHEHSGLSVQLGEAKRVCSKYSTAVMGPKRQRTSMRRAWTNCACSTRW